LKKVFRGLHIGWALFGAGVCGVLATATGGHPPGLVFVPVAAVIWLGGHVLLWGSHKLAARGRDLAAADNAPPGNWPPMIILLTFALGVVFVFGFFFLAWQLLFERHWQRGMFAPVTFWTLASFCFFGILLRQDWSRILAGSGFIVVAALLLYEMIMSAIRGYRNSNTEWVVVVVIFVMLTLVGLYVLRSSAIKSYFSRSPGK
jgi:hypothetical protein